MVLDFYQNSEVTAFLGKPYEPEMLNDVLQKSFRSNSVDETALYEATEAGNLDCHDILLHDAQVIGFDVVDEMVSLFFKTSQESIDAIEDSFVERQWQELSKQAHKLKSASSSIGLNDLWSLTDKLEIAARAEAVNDVNALYEKFGAVYLESCDTLRTVWQGIKQTQPDNDVE